MRRPEWIPGNLTQKLWLRCPNFSSFQGSRRLCNVRVISYSRWGNYIEGKRQQPWDWSEGRSWVEFPSHRERERDVEVTEPDNVLLLKPPLLSQKEEEQDCRSSQFAKQSTPLLPLLKSLVNHRQHETSSSRTSVTFDCWQDWFINGLISIETTTTTGSPFVSKVIISCKHWRDFPLVNPQTWPYSVCLDLQLEKWSILT